jgi:RHS repeat-associated protein
VPVPSVHETSFSGTSGTLSGGVAATYAPATVYDYAIAGSAGASGYAANGNLVSYTDLMDGGWSLTYDNVNRVSTAVATSGVWDNLTLSWTYDSFGNRKTQTPSGKNIAAPVPEAQTLSYPSENRISNYGASGYDGAGNVIYDLINHYLYDPEGRLCAVEYSNGTATEYMLYLYDGEGRRVAKVSNPTFSCTPATGSTLQESYLLGPSGEHITELGQAGSFLRSNVYANGQLLATYTNNQTYFALNDWLGSKRVVTKYDGTVTQMCMNLPFGDELMCSAPDLSEHHFTGQIHDQETGNDNFNARYYANSTGRFLSPDPSGLTYANPYNPQSLNLYSYVLNNPLTNIDPTGKDCVYLFDDASSLEEVDADSDTSASDCDTTGGTHVEGHLTGYGSTDSDGTINEFYSNAYGTQNGSQNGLPNPSTLSGFSNYLNAFLNGSSPTNVLYGPGNTATQQMQNTQNVQKLTNQYIQNGCPGTPGNPAPLGQGHASAYIDSATNSPPNPTQIEVGGYSGGIYTVNGTSTFTINNPSSMSSLDGESALNGSHSSDNPNGPTGAGHTVNQTFQWTEAGLCGH